MPTTTPPHVPTLDRWRTLDHDAALAVARSAARQVGADEVEVSERTFATDRMLVASLVVDGVSFVLVPGGQASLGHDASGFVPTEEELASFRDDEWALFTEGIDPSAPPSPLVTNDEDVVELRAYLAEHLTRPRTTRVPPLLVATDPVEAGLTPVPADHPAVVAHLAECPWQPPTLGHEPDWFAQENDPTTYVRLRFGPSGEVTEAWLAAFINYDTVVDELAAQGRRLLSPDEWEWVYGLGAGTLFPWGDRFPNRYDHIADTNRIVEAVPGGMVIDDSVSNVLGLRLAVNSYKPELTSVRAEVRGGDFGESACGGMSRFYQLLLTAPAYRDPECVAAEHGRADVRHRLYRPVIPLG